MKFNYTNQNLFSKECNTSMSLSIKNPRVYVQIILWPWPWPNQQVYGLLDLLFAILEQNMNNNRTEDSKKSLKYVLISCIPRSSTSIFLPYLFLLSIKYPSRYSSMDTHLSKLAVEAFDPTSSSWRGPNLNIVKKAADQSLRTLWIQKDGWVVTHR